MDKEDTGSAFHIAMARSTPRIDSRLGRPAPQLSEMRMNHRSMPKRALGKQMLSIQACRSRLWRSAEQVGIVLQDGIGARGVLDHICEAVVFGEDGVVAVAADEGVGASSAGK